MHPMCCWTRSLQFTAAHMISVLLTTHKRFSRLFHILSTCAGMHRPSLLKDTYSHHKLLTPVTYRQPAGDVLWSFTKKLCHLWQCDLVSVNHTIPHTEVYGGVATSSVLLWHIKIIINKVNKRVSNQRQKWISWVDLPYPKKLCYVMLMWLHSEAALSKS